MTSGSIEEVSNAHAAGGADPIAANGSAATLKGGFGVVLMGLMLAMGLAAMDQSIVNTALPRITADLGGVTRLSWVVTAFLLSSTISTPLYGKLSDMYGRRRLMTVSISIFLAGSILCGLAHSMLQLIAFRAVQGLGAGGLLTLSQTVVGDLVSPRERGRYQGLFSGVFAISSVAGPVIGGGLTMALSWRWVFYVNLPLGALALVLIVSGLKGGGATRRHAVDYPGAILLAACAASILLLFSWGLSQEGSTLLRLGLGGAAVASTALVILQERRAAEPILDLRLFAIRTFTVGVSASATMAFAMMGSLVFLPLYIQLVLGRSPLAAGLVVTPQIAGMLLTSIVGGRAVSRVGRVKPFLVSGVGLEVLALWGLGVAAALAAPAWLFSVIVFTLGLGMGIGMPNAVTAVQNAVDSRQMGAAIGAMSFMRSLGGAAGVSLSGGVMSLVLVLTLGHAVDAAQVHAVLHGGAKAFAGVSAAARTDLVHAYRRAIEASFLLSGAIMTAAFVLVCTMPDDDLRGREAA